MGSDPKYICQKAPSKQEQAGRLITQLNNIGARGGGAGGTGNTGAASSDEDEDDEEMGGNKHSEAAADATSQDAYVPMIVIQSLCSDALLLKFSPVQFTIHQKSLVYQPA